MNEIVRVPFHGTDLLTLKVDSKPHIVLRPAVEAIGLNYPTQLAKLKGRSWACISLRDTQLPGDTQSRTHTTVDVRTLLMLLATVDEHRVAEHVRPLLVAYQREVADVIESYWTTGAAVQPGVEVGPQHEIPQTLAQALRLAADQFERAEQAEALAAEQGQELETARPKATYVDTFVEGGGDATTFRVLAGQLNVSERALRRHLADHKVIYRRVVDTHWSTTEGKEVTEYEWLAHSKHRAWFVPRDQPKAPRLHNGQLRTTLYVTPVGKAGIARMLERTPIEAKATGSNVRAIRGGAA